MVDLQTVCCMCGDVGFSDKLFRCSRCRHRFQHSYCSNYYSGSAVPSEVCDWCLYEEKNSSPRNGNPSSSRNINRSASNVNELRSPYSGDKIKHHARHDGGGGGPSAERAAGKIPSPRTATRRYKLLKDVMC